MNKILNREERYRKHKHLLPTLFDKIGQVKKFHSFNENI